MLKKLLWLLLVLPTIVIAEEEAAEIAYIPLDKPLVTNVQGPVKYVKAEVQLMTERADTVDKIKQHLPAIRHSLLLLMSSKQGEELRHPDGKEKLREESLETVQETLKKYAGKKLVDELYFTAFFVQ